MGRAVLSPPPAMGISRMGPVLMPNSPKRRKQEKVNRRFTEEVLDVLELDDRFTLFRMLGATEYTDPRPFNWAGFEVAPAFTYHVEVGSRSIDDLFASFSKSLRREMRKLDEFDLQIGVEGANGARETYSQLQDRYREQDRAVPGSWPFVRDLHDALGDDHFRTYVARDPDGAFLGGIIVLYSNDTAYYWLGGAKASYRNVSVNNLLHRTIMEDLIDDPALDSVDTYDLIGANTERLASYKAKFGGELVPYYIVESDGVGMDIAKKAYQFATR